MVKKLQKPETEKKKNGARLADTVKDSAQQIWLAGLGAFSKAQEEGGKVFDTLVKEGLNIQRKTQTVAEEKLTEASNRMTSIASDLGSKAQGQWDKLENIFEARVLKALSRLGVPSAQDLQALNERIDALDKTVAAGAKPAAKTAARSPGRSATAKKTTLRRAKPAAQKSGADAADPTPPAGP